jgi:hypothetical protein
MTKKSTLASRIGPNSLLLFQRLNINVGWLGEPIASWGEIPGFQKLKAFVDNLETVNDSCERAVKTTSDFANKYSDETEFQDALLVINKARKDRPKALKKSFVKGRFQDQKKCLVTEGLTQPPSEVHGQGKGVEDSYMPPALRAPTPEMAVRPYQRWPPARRRGIWHGGP